MARHRRAPRRGVVLLVILSLLVLFALLGVTFVIVSGQYKRSANAYMRAETYGDDWSRQLDTAMYIALRDTPDAANPIRTHSLLNDIYGHEYAKGTVATAPVDLHNGQVRSFECTFTTTAPTQAGYFNGCVITFYRPSNSSSTSNRLAGISTRVIGYGVDTMAGTYTLRIMRPVSDDAAGSNNTHPQVGDSFIINGRPFTGAGAGFNPSTGKLDQQKSGQKLVLGPNRVGETNADLIGDSTTPGYLYGGANENWDAPDLQNLFLSAVIPDVNDPSGIQHVDIGGKRYPCIYPSFHRPDLIRNQGSKSIRNTLRPISNAGSSFPTLGDPADASLTEADRFAYGPWDVDNDGDGIADSIWIDVNLPVQTSSDGRRYKPLVAYHIVDLDGRLNVNFHGNEQHIAMLDLDNDDELVGNTRLYLANNSAIRTSSLPKGHGAGPAEVVLGPPVTPSNNNPTGHVHNTTNPVGFFKLSKALNQQIMATRYGGDGVPGNGSAIAADDISATKFFEIPGLYSTAGVSTYSSPPDLRGQLAVGIDARGHLMMDAPEGNPGDLRVGAAYRTRRIYDRRFVPTELERILRAYDLDAGQLPDRLQSAAGEAFTHTLSSPNEDVRMARVNRRIVTTDSYDVPVATVTNTDSTGFDPRRDLLALLRTKNNSLTDAQWLKLIDRDFFLGLKMNLNRPLGDGENNNNPGSVFAALADEHEPYVDRDGSGTITADDFPESKGAFDKGQRLLQGEDVNGDGQVNAVDEWFARQQLAKHLYILASLCVDTGIEDGVTPEKLNVQRQLAQWAVNVVDFRDADSIMTCFEYSPNPFTVWPAECDGRPTGVGETISATYGRVWGCERPELLLSESFFMHDRRTLDTADEEPVAAGTQTEKGKTTDMMTKKDEDFDQKLLPQGSGFIELYAPWTGAFERQPPELYQGNTGLMLNARTPEATGSSPIWRIIIVKDQLNADPDKLDPTEAGPQIDPANDIERSIYFTDPSGIADDHGRPYYCDHDLAPLLPGRYAVVGSGPASPTNGKYVTYAGYRTSAIAPDTGVLDDTTLADTRQFVLTPSANASTNQFEILNNDHPTYPDPGADVQPRIAAVINRTTGATPNRRFSISEPVDGYPSSGTLQVGDLSLITPVVDEPYDATGPFKDDLMKDGTREQWRAVYLQRLANPLSKHNKDTNPYLTIDSIGADLTVFNGVTNEAEKYNSADIPKHTSEDSFESMERGEGPAPGSAPRLLWKATNSSENLQTAESDPDHYWPYRIKNSLGYLNIPWQPFATAADANNVVWKGDPKIDSTNGTPALVPFPWLTFSNRPFNSVYELMEVPAVRSSQLTLQYGLPTALANPYVQDASTYRYGHLFNFFYAPNPAPNNQVHSLHRLFDYLRIPSKFVESETMLTATNFVSGSLADNQFHPPYNWLSNFRDPGLVNVNTIYSENVWNAILAGDPANQGPTFAELVMSRRGDGNASADILVRDGNNATDFAGAFRAPGTGDMGGAAVDPIEMTILRKYPAAGTNVSKQGLPLFGNTSAGIHNNAARHPYFRHQTLHRLSNTLTTRSNVYAMWVTIGYFEVDSSGALGQELHADTGEIKRHRAFYMIDRTIPVGFEPGENHNVDRAILVRRYIE